MLLVEKKVCGGQLKKGQKEIFDYKNFHFSFVCFFAAYIRKLRKLFLMKEMVFNYIRKRFTNLRCNQLPVIQTFGLQAYSCTAHQAFPLQLNETHMALSAVPRRCLPSIKSCRNPIPISGMTKRNKVQNVLHSSVII